MGKFLIKVFAFFAMLVVLWFAGFFAFAFTVGLLSEVMGLGGYR